MSSKTELQEQIELLQAEIAAANSEIIDLKSAISKNVKAAKAKAQKQSAVLEQERKRLYDEAKDAHTQSLQVGKDIYKNFKNEAEDNLGIVAKAVREEVMNCLELVFGNENLD